MEKAPVVAGLVVFLASLAAYLTLSILKLNTDGLLIFVAAAAGIGGFASWRNTETIKRQTNGPLTEMASQVAHLVERVDKLENIENVAQDISTRLEHVEANTNGG